ncbi:MAG: alpha-L-fucosidase [Candidatus Hydrogenedentales bacterium]|jgi:alpha-L-fucosidase
MRTARYVVAAVFAVAAFAAFAQDAQYEPTWESLESRPLPGWFEHDKFGIFIHWGLYSVPSWGPKGRYSEWYWHDMQDKNGETWKFHVENYGEDFKYPDFAPQFRAEMFNPAHWAEIFERSGAKYVVLTSKHHEGFCLWPNAESWNWNSVDAGPGRDLCGELTEAVKARGLKMGFYFSLYEWFNPIYRNDPERYVEQHMLPQFKDLVLRYEPDIVWPDGEWDHPDTLWRSTEFIAWLYNESPVRDRVVVNDRWGKGCRSKHGGFYTTEYGQVGWGQDLGSQHKWEECRGIGKSFGFNRNEEIDDYMTPRELIRMLISICNGGGNLLLDIGPTADGRIPVIMEQRLLAMGDWLRENGQAIYGTGPSPFPSLPWGRCTSAPGKLYLHVFDWPEDALEVPGLKNEVTKAYLLTRPDLPLTVTRTGERAVSVALPEHMPNQDATVVVLEISGAPDVDMTIHAAEDGRLTLPAAQAQILGKTARYEAERDAIGFWTEPGDSVSWHITAGQPGKFEVALTYACNDGSGGTPVEIRVGDSTVTARVKETGSWSDFITDVAGIIEIPAAGVFPVTVSPEGKPVEGVMNLRALSLRPTQ